MAQLEPWTYPMMEYYRKPNDRRPPREGPGSQKDHAFPWSSAVKATNEQREKQQAKEAKHIEQWKVKASTKFKNKHEDARHEGSYNDRTLDEYLKETDLEVHAARVFRARHLASTAQKYSDLHKQLQSNYDPDEAEQYWQQPADAGAVTSPTRRAYTAMSQQQQTGSDWATDSRRSAPVRQALNPLAKAKARLDVARHRVEMYEDELKTAIPHSEHYHTVLRGTLASALCYNYRLCHHKVVSRPQYATESGADMDGIIEIVGVIVEQTEELLEHLESMCMRGLHQHRLVVKDYTIALQVALRGLLHLDGSKVGWLAVRREVRDIADIAVKADEAIIFVHHHIKENAEFGAKKIVLPEKLRLKKKVEKKTANRQRSRIDDYLWHSIPEVQREAMKQKNFLASLTRKERENNVLTSMTQYKKTSWRTGTHRMSKADENRVHQTVKNISAHYMKEAFS